MRCPHPQQLRCQPPLRGSALAPGAHPAAKRSRGINVARRRDVGLPLRRRCCEGEGSLMAPSPFSVTLARALRRSQPPFPLCTIRHPRVLLSPGLPPALPPAPHSPRGLAFGASSPGFPASLSPIPGTETFGRGSGLRTVRQRQAHGSGAWERSRQASRAVPAAQSWEMSS